MHAWTGKDCPDPGAPHLVRQVAVGNVAVGEDGRVHERAVRDAHAVVQLVPAPAGRRREVSFPRHAVCFPQLTPYPVREDAPAILAPHPAYRYPVCTHCNPRWPSSGAGKSTANKLYLHDWKWTMQAQVVTYAATPAKPPLPTAQKRHISDVCRQMPRMRLNRPLNASTRPRRIWRGRLSNRGYAEGCDPTRAVLTGPARTAPSGRAGWRWCPPRWAAPRRPAGSAAPGPGPSRCTCAHGGRSSTLGFF